MSNHMKKCGCKSCRRGMHSKYGGVIMRLKIRVNRRNAKLALKKGQDPDNLISVPYTD